MNKIMLFTDGFCKNFTEKRLKQDNFSLEQQEPKNWALITAIAANGRHLK